MTKKYLKLETQCMKCFLGGLLLWKLKCFEWYKSWFDSWKCNVHFNSFELQISLFGFCKDKTKDSNLCRKPNVQCLKLTLKYYRKDTEPYIILLCTHLYNTSVRYLSITCNVLIVCYIRCKKFIIFESTTQFKVRRSSDQVVL